MTGEIAGSLRVGGAASEGVNDSKPDFQAVAYTIQTNDGGSHRCKDRPEGGMYVKEVETALALGSSDQAVVAYGVSENQRAEVRLTEYSRQITSGGGKPGQGYPAVLEIHGGSKRKDRPDGGFYVRKMPTTKPLDTGGLNPNCAQGGMAVLAFANVSDGSGARNAKNLAQPLTARHGDPGSVAGSFGVRRLTPVECERLQGFPDGWTEGQSDTARYRQLGNAVAVPVAEWIGHRIVRAGLD